MANPKKSFSIRGAVLLGAAGLLLALLVAAPAVAQGGQDDPATGVLVVVPDRGFLGNSEVRDAFETFAQDRNAALLYVTDERSEKILDERLATLRQHGAKRIEVLPLVMSTADARWKLAEGWLQARQAKGLELALARPYGSSYLAVEDLSARLRDAESRLHRVLLVGYGAGTSADAEAMRKQLKAMGGFATTLAPDAIDAVVYPARHAKDQDALRKQVDKAIAAAHGALVVPVALAPRDDSMMAFAHWFGDSLPKDAELVTTPIAAPDALAQWMRHAALESNLRFAPLKPSEVGVVVLAHGADWFWNQAIEHALAPLTHHYKVAWAFSMADPVVVERGIRQLEHDGARAIVVVRVFGLPSSFRAATRRMLGLDVADGKPAAAGHGHGMMHHGMAADTGLAAAPRIRTALPLATVGGVGDDPLFARALLENARAVSRDPSRETVILVAHGAGDDPSNEHWLGLLDHLAAEMRRDGGDAFRAIRYATWREDWPDKREPAIAQVREMVKEAQRDGGRALIVPARTNQHGGADRYLEGLDFGWSKRGFAQTPFFEQWVAQEVERGIDVLQGGGAQATASESAAAGHHH